MHVFRFPAICCFLTILVLAITSVAGGEEPVKLWHENRITPEQPFPARVVGVVPSWIGYALLLEEITDKEPRYCVAKLWATHDLEYTIVKDKKAFEDVHDSHKATYLDPGVSVDDFSWSIGAFTIGRRFGDKDFVTQQYPRWTKGGDAREREAAYVPYRSALTAALHLLAANGEADHIAAILREHPDLVDAKRKFTQPRKPVRTDDYSPLHHAVENGRQAVVSVLLEHGADVNRSINSMACCWRTGSSVSKE